MLLLERKPPTMSPNNEQCCTLYLWKSTFKRFIFVSMRRVGDQTEKDQLLGVLDGFIMVTKLWGVPPNNRLLRGEAFKSYTAMPCWILMETRRSLFQEQEHNSDAWKMFNKYLYYLVERYCRIRVKHASRHESRWLNFSGYHFK